MIFLKILLPEATTSYFYIPASFLIIRAAVLYCLLPDIPRPAKNSMFPPVAKALRCLSQNSLSAAVFLPFCGIAARRSLCTTFGSLSLRAAPKVLIHERSMPKINIFIFWHLLSMNRCPASARSINRPGFGGALVPLRGGF